MGLFDKAKDALGDNVPVDKLVDKIPGEHLDKARSAVDQAKGLVSEHGDKLPGGAADTVGDVLDQADSAFGDDADNAAEADDQSEGSDEG